MAKTTNDLKKLIAKTIDDASKALTPEQLEKRVSNAVANIGHVLTPEQIKARAERAAANVGKITPAPRVQSAPKTMRLPPTLEENARLSYLLEGRDVELVVGPPDDMNGGARHRYEVRKKSTGETVMVIQFQAGPTREGGVNGVLPEVVIACVADHLRGFQAGPMACVETGFAIQALDGIVMSKLVQRRMRRRTAGVLGTRSNFASANTARGPVE